MGCGASSHPVDEEKPQSSDGAADKSASKPGAADSQPKAAADKGGSTSDSSHPNAAIPVATSLPPWATHPLVAALVPRCRAPPSQWFVERTAGMSSKLAVFDTQFKSLVDSCSTQAGLTDSSSLASTLNGLRSAQHDAVAEMACGLNKLQLCELTVNRCGIACGSAGPVCILPFSKLYDSDITSLALLDADVAAAQILSMQKLQQQLAQASKEMQEAAEIQAAREVVYFTQATEEEAAAALTPLEAAESKCSAKMSDLQSQAISAGSWTGAQLRVLSRWCWGAETGCRNHQVLLQGRVAMSKVSFARQLPRTNGLSAAQIVQLKVMSDPSAAEVVQALTHNQALEVATTKLNLIASWTRSEGTAAEASDKLCDMLQQAQALEHLEKLQSPECDQTAEEKVIEFVMQREAAVSSLMTF